MDTDNRTSPFIPEAADSHGTTAPRIRTDGRGQPDVTFYFGAADRTERGRRGNARMDTDDPTSRFIPEAADSHGTTAPRIRTDGHGQPDVTFYSGGADIHVTPAPRIRTDGHGRPDITFYFGAADRTERQPRIRTEGHGQPR